MGGWVGGWEEEKRAVGVRCSAHSEWVGGWVRGWVGRRTYLSDLDLHSRNVSRITHGEVEGPGWLFSFEYAFQSSCVERTGAFGGGRAPDVSWVDAD